MEPMYVLGVFCGVDIAVWHGASAAVQGVAVFSDASEMQDACAIMVSG